MKRDVVVVTGASAGVGRAVVREFARRRAKIGLIARGMDGLEAAKAEVEELGGEAIIARADVAKHDEVEAAAQATEDAFGPIDIWINNAMASVFAPIRELTSEELHRVTDVTYHGVVHGTMAALRRMLPRNRGKIVQVGSALAYRGIPLQAAYCGAKHAIQGFNDSLQAELIHDGSKVGLTMVNLPAINTPQFDWVLSKLPNRAQPVPPIFQPEVAADAIVWAAYHDRRELNVSFRTSEVIIGNAFFPALGDRYLAKNGYDAQQTNEPEPPNRPHNLWEPLPGDHGAHGRFDDQAKPESLSLTMNLNRAPLLAAGAGVLLGILLARRL
ncbi:MAG TPA: SDR family oxidoreductase [Thermoanaerobaculia bacterium]|nr:SDR family oxidoreductase [Thermoanaerobaculia bacterium]